MHNICLTLLLLTGTSVWHTASAQVSPWKKDTYHFGQTKKAPPKKLPKALPGRVHLLDGTTRSVPLAYVDYNKVVAVENGTETVYTPLEAGSFVVQQDSFVVLRDFKVAVGTDEQDFRIAFVQVGVVGPGFALYHFKGTMRREIPASLGPGGMGRVEETTQYLPSKAWFLKLDNDPRWLSLPKSGGRIQTVVEPLIADDKKLAKSVHWDFLDADEVQELLLKYIADKKAGLK